MPRYETDDLTLSTPGQSTTVTGSIKVGEEISIVLNLIQRTFDNDGESVVDAQHLIVRFDSVDDLRGLILHLESLMTFHEQHAQE